MTYPMLDRMELLLITQCLQDRIDKLDETHATTELELYQISKEREELNGLKNYLWHHIEL